MPAIVSMGTLVAGKATLLQRQGSRFHVQDRRIKRLPLKGREFVGGDFSTNAVEGEGAPFATTGA
jgi:hypothetical protein